MYFKAEISENGNVCRIETSCTLSEICSCISVVTNQIYKKLPDEDARKAFKFAIKKGFADDIPFKDMDDQKDERGKEENEKEDGEKSGNAKELLGLLKELRDLID